MTAPGGSRRTRHDRSAVGASVLVAAIIHAAAAGVASATHLFGAGWDDLGQPPTARLSTGPAIPLPPLEPTCDGDALLAVAARALTCASPFVDDRARCVAELTGRLESDRLRCHVEELAPVAFTFDRVDGRKLPQLDPEPLLETLTPEPPPPSPTPPTPLTPTPPEQPQVAQAVQPSPPPAPVTRPPQTIETVKPTTELAPDDTRFVSEHNTKVERQTVARGSNQEDLVARSKPAELAVKPEPRDPSVAEPPKDDAVGKNPDAPRVPGSLSMRAPGAPDPVEVAQEPHERGAADGRLDPVGDGREVRRGNGRISTDERRPSELPRGDGGAGGGSPKVPDLRASEDVLERALGGGSVDHLEEIEEGDETALNSKQWVYASFFNRMKRRVHQNWDPVSVWRRHDPTGTVYGAKSRLTRLRITLGPNGALRKVIVVSPSGVDVLDDEAMRAFRAAQPFPNPPVGLVDATGAISFEFGFHLEVNNGRSQWQIFRAM